MVKVGEELVTDIKEIKRRIAKLQRQELIRNKIYEQVKREDTIKGSRIEALEHCLATVRTTYK